jgi:hypothetical protein
MHSPVFATYVLGCCVVMMLFMIVDGLRSPLSLVLPCMSNHIWNNFRPQAELSISRDQK